MKLLTYIAHLTSQPNRQEAARNLARYLKADDLVIFIPDHQLGMLLPGPGFPQSLPNGEAWRSFFNSSEAAIYQGLVPYPDKDSTTAAWAVRGNDASLAVLIGGDPGRQEIETMQVILPIVIPLFKQEQAALVIQSQARQNARNAEKAERLTVMLDGIRQNLVRVLAENARLLQATRQKNDELAVANQELAAANEEIITGLEELNASNRALERINADMDNFIYTASHDLKAPISNIEGLVKMLIRKLHQNGWENEMTRKMLEMIIASVDRFKETIADLTEVSKIGKEASKEEVMINLLEVIEAVKLDLAQVIAGSEARIEMDIPESAVVVFSRKNLKSIVYNLLSNAIKYRSYERCPVIRLLWKTEGGYNVLSVTDNGLGMDAADIHKVFGMFKRLHTHVEGTGIGLYIVKRMVENAGGKIELESQLGTGTTFRVFFKRQK